MTKEEVVAARRLAGTIASPGGPDLRNMSDEELAAHMKKAATSVADAMAKFGISAAEAAKAGSSLSDALNALNRPH